MQISLTARLITISDHHAQGLRVGTRNLLSLLILLALTACDAATKEQESDEIVRIYDASYLDELLAGDFNWHANAPAEDAVRSHDWLREYTAGSAGKAVASIENISTSEVRTGWTVVLKTFTGDDHREAGSRMTQQLPQIAPGLDKVFVHSTDDSSMVAYGFYDEPTAPDAQAGLERVKSTEFRGRPVFPRAMLSPIQIGEEREMSPYDLRIVRKTYPRIRDLYTLDIAVWGDFDSGEWSRERIRQTAETFCMQLRAKGVEAYFFHNDLSGMSSVSVGVFDQTAYDAQSQMLSSQVRDQMKQFPYRLTNGEPLYMLEDPNRPETSRKIPQPSMLSIIPE
ncbi:MAG: hypothetical protein KC983_05695 [Phycisphaerales bacterium]|nr:hypothetical protein [Phycisphaerales bacterium]